jgi:HlyD family secretion protein
VKEGDYVHAGDTLAILEVPEIDAQKKAAEATKDAASAINEMADNGARKETIQGAYQVWQQAIAAADIAKKTYDRVSNLFSEGVVSAQKRDEAFAAYKASEAAVLAAKSQYQMAKNGARVEEKKVASNQVKAADGAVDVMKSLLRETVQVAQYDGEVSDIYPKVGELVGLGSPIMSISIMDNLWGTFNVREDQLKGLGMGATFTAYSPAFDKDIKMKVYYVKDQGSYAAWRATKANGEYDLKTFEIKARPITKLEGLRPGMTLVVKK